MSGRNSNPWSCLTAVLLCGVLFVMSACGVAMLFSGGTSVRTGGSCVLRSGAGVMIASDRKAFYRMIQLSVANDRDGLVIMAGRGEVLSVPDGTPARLIDGGLMSCEVRITAGQHRGRSGFVASEFVQPR